MHFEQHPGGLELRISEECNVAAALVLLFLAPSYSYSWNPYVLLFIISHFLFCGFGKYCVNVL